MKIKETVSSEKFQENNDYRCFLEIEVDGKKECGFSDGEPEDANLNRDYSDCYNIVSLMKRAHEAGKNGEELIIEEIESDEWI